MRLSGASRRPGLYARGPRAQQQGLRAGLRRQNVLSRPGRGRRDRPAAAANAGGDLRHAGGHVPSRHVILSVRNNRKVMIVDLNGPEPTVTPTADLDQERTWSTPTVMADGKVLVS